jgi:rhodanese-related sulfurtransferase
MLIERATAGAGRSRRLHMHRSFAARAFLFLVVGVVSLAPGLPLSAQAPAAPAAAAQPPAAPEVWRITAEELKPMVDKGEAVLLDVRSKPAWDGGHIQGAIHIPTSELRARLSELPKDKLVAAYCTCHAEASSAGAAILLKQNGYKAAALKDGVTAWQRVGGKVTPPVQPAN